MYTIMERVHVDVHLIWGFSVVTGLLSLFFENLWRGEDAKGIMFELCSISTRACLKREDNT